MIISRITGIKMMVGDEYTKNLEELEEAQASEDDSNEIPPSDIVAFNELRSCSDLKRLHDTNQLEIKPDYQRDLVWSPALQTRFIDSLSKQLPIPSMCISFDYKTGKRQMVDGLQRMSSIIRFLSQDNWRLSNLDDIDPKISNKKVEDIKSKNEDIYSRVENTAIPITVIRCDLSKKSHQEYLFTIFHRLNTGGSKLTNQEIRNCIYQGPMNTMLKKCVSLQLFIDTFSIDEKKKYRFSNEELLLRILAFSQSNVEKYKGPLAKYLNNFMSNNRNINDDKIQEFETLITESIALVYEKILGNEPLPRLSKATLEALFVAVIRNLETLRLETNEQLKEKYETLRKDDLFSVIALSEGLAAPDKVKGRINRACEIFAQT